MTVENVYRTEIGVRLHPDRDPLLAAVPRRRTGHLRDAFQFNREPAQDGIAVLLLAVAYCRMKMIFPTEPRCDQRRLIGVGGARPTEIQFLQAHDISRHARDHFRDASFRALPIHPDTTVDVVGSDT